MRVTSSSLCIGYMRNICLYARTLSLFRSLSIAASVSPARVDGVSAVAFSGGRGPIAVMFLALLDERVVRALQIRLLLHEFEDPSLVRQRRGFGFVRHLL